jgi:Glyoxalase-like domain
MRLDHLVYAAGPDGLAATSERLSELLGEKFLDGGVHPRFGTENMILPLSGGQYLEVVDVLDHPASDKAAFGQLVRARSEAGGGWLGWAVRVDDISEVESRLGRKAVEGNRHRPDGIELHWRQIGPSLQGDPQLPFFMQWDVPEDLHPSAGATGDIGLDTLVIAGDATALASWLDTAPDRLADDYRVECLLGRPGLVSARFTTPDGIVAL